MAGGLVVMKSNASPLMPIPSLSIKNNGKFLSGFAILRLKASSITCDHCDEGINVETSAPVVVVPIVPLPT